MEETEYKSLLDYLAKVPAIQTPIGIGTYPDGCWGIKFKINIENPLAWNVVQELGCVVNYLSINEKLPTSFYPVSPAPYLNGGPIDFLSWIIETNDQNFRPETLLTWLEGRLPRPVDDLEQWNTE